MMLPLAAYAVACLFLALVMAAAWLAQRRTGNGGWADAFWSLGLGTAGFALALIPLAGQPWPTPRQLLVAVLAGAWGLRLGLHIALRSSKGSEDPRYAQLRREWGDDFQRRLFLFLQIQALVAAVLALSVLLAAQNPQPGLHAHDFFGALVLIIAVLGEALADAQLRRFRADPDHGAVCESGLWRWSRHPNYFFEWLGWCAYPLFAFAPTNYPFGLLAVSGPILMYWLLMHVSGIPPLETHMLRSRGDAFRAYQARVPAFFPGPTRQNDSS